MRLCYYVSGTTRRFVLYVKNSSCDETHAPLFLGYADFDARQCGNYSAFPLVLNNAIASTACGCSPDASRAHTTGGTATLELLCDNPNCSGIGDGGEGFAMMDSNRLRNDVDGAAAMLASVDKKKNCCFG